MTKKQVKPTGKDTKFSKVNQPSDGTRKEGRAKRKIMTEALMLSLNQEVIICAEKGIKTKRLRQIADMLITKAVEGDIQAIKEVFDRTEGKAAQAIDLSSSDGTMSPRNFNEFYPDKKAKS